MAFLRNWSELYSLKLFKMQAAYDHERETHFWTWTIPTLNRKISQPQIHKHKAQCHQGGINPWFILLQIMKEIDMWTQPYLHWAAPASPCS